MKNKTIILLILLAVFAGISVYLYVNNKSLIKDISRYKAITKNILSTSFPLKYIQGNIQKIEGNNLILETEYSEKGVIRVIVTDKTVIKTEKDQKKAAVSDLGKGQTVIVSSETDLRLLDKPEFEASYITILPPPRSIDAFIEDISGNTLTVKGAPIQQSILPRIPNQYKVKIDDKTQILSNSSSDTTQKLNAKVLVKNMRLMIESDTDITPSTEFSAKKIIISIPINQ